MSLPASYAFSVQVSPRYLPDASQPDDGVFVFAYTITVTNTGSLPAQLVARHWLIHDASGHVQQVHGLGVVGRQPLLSPGQTFEYTSHCHLRTPQGSMQGSYFFVAEDGARFDVPVPVFALNAQMASAKGAAPAASLHIHTDDAQARVLH